MKICLVAVNIRSTHNVGALFRTCDGLGADLVLVGITPRPTGGVHDDRLPHIATRADKAISKTALGAEKSVKWRYFEDIDKTIKLLRKEGYKICAIEQHKNSLPIDNLKTENNMALLVGPEVEGLSEKTLEKVDVIYEIPMKGVKESLNVSVASAIALYQAKL